MTHSDLEAILAQDDWLRRIARGLIRDPGLADDLAQDVWIKSLEHGEEERSWLTVVLRNARARFFRSEGRERARREDVGRTAESCERSTDEIAMDLELREMIAHELAALEDPCRTAVYMRFVADRSLKEIAQRTGVAPSTASERVTRGLELLRKRMDESHGGDRRTWAVHLIPFARSSGFARTLIGSIAMTGMTKVAVSTAIVVAVLMLASKLVAPKAPTDPKLAETEAQGAHTSLAANRSTSEALSSPAERLEARTPGAPDDATGVATGTATTSNRGRAHIVARVRLAGGAPAAGARWSLSGQASQADHVQEVDVPDDWVNPDGTLGADGTLDVLIDPPQSFEFRLRIEAPEHVVATWNWHHITPSDVKDLGEVTMRAAGTVRGRVVDPDGQPISGRNVVVYAEEHRKSALGSMSAMEPVSVRAKVDTATGTFVTEGLPEGPVQLSAWTPVLGSFKGPRVHVTALQSVEAEIVLAGLDEAATRILVSASCQPYFSVPRPKPESIWLVAPDGSRRHAEANGMSLAMKFDAADAPPYRVEVVDPRFEPWSQDGIGTGTTVRARLKGSAGVTLDVRDGEGEDVPLYSVDVEFLNVGYRPNEFQPHDGKEPLVGGALDGLVPGDYRLTIRGAPGVASVRVDGLKAGQRRSVSVVLGDSDLIAGRVVRADGTPVSGARVRLVHPAKANDSPRSRVLPRRSFSSSAEKFRWVQDSVTTDGDGRFACEFPPEGVYIIIAGDDGRPRIESQPFSLAVGERIEDISLVLPEGTGLAGRIRQPAGLDLADWRVLPLRPDDGRMQILAAKYTLVVGGGSFDCGELPPGRVDLYLLRPGNGASFDPDMVPLDAQLLEHLVLVEGQDVDRTYPFPGTVPTEVSFVIRVESVATDGATVRLYPVGSSKERYRIDGTRAQVGPEHVQPGDYDVWVSGPGWGARLLRPVTVAGGGETIELEVELRTGRVQVLHAGQPVVNERFLLRPSLADFRTIQSFQSDAEGWVHLRAGPGDYLLEPQSPGRPSTQLAWPLPGGVTELSLD